MDNCSYPESQFDELVLAGPPSSYDCEEDAFSSDFSDVERDIDAEIEANLQHDARLPPSSPPPAPRTVSQWMLHTLQKKRNPASLEPRCRMPSRAVALAPGDSAFDLRSGLDEYTSERKSERLIDDKAVFSRSRRTSCTDRMTARITKSVLSKRGSEKGRFGMNGGQYVSALYPDRRTYPAESLRKAELARSSENTMTPQENAMLEILDMERSSRVYGQQRVGSEVLSQMNSNDGVRFHFGRGSSIYHDALDRSKGNLVATNERTGAGVVTALVNVQHAKHVTHPDYSKLASQLARVEAHLNDMESFLKTPSFTVLATRPLTEMVHLTKTTQQIRVSGTTLILANVGKHQNADIVQALRRLVARAAFVQQRISVLMLAVKKIA